MEKFSFIDTHSQPALAALTIAHGELSAATDAASSASGNARAQENSLQGAKQSLLHFRDHGHTKAPASGDEGEAPFQAKIDERMVRCTHAWCREQSTREPLLAAMVKMQSALAVAVVALHRNDSTRTSWADWEVDTLRINIIASQQACERAFATFERIRPYDISRRVRQPFIRAAAEAVHYSDTLPQLPQDGNTNRLQQFELLTRCLAGHDSVVVTEFNDEVIEQVAERLRSSCWRVVVQTAAEAASAGLSRTMELYRPKRRD